MNRVRRHNPIEDHAVPKTFTVAQRFCVLTRRVGLRTVASGDRNVRVEGPISRKIILDIETAASILRNDVDYFKVTPQYIFITLIRKEK